MRVAVWIDMQLHVVPAVELCLFDRYLLWFFTPIDVSISNDTSSEWIDFSDAGHREQTRENLCGRFGAQIHAFVDTSHRKFWAKYGNWSRIWMS